MRISIIQMDIELGKPKNNYKHAIDLMTKAMDDAPDVIILPEMFSTAYAIKVFYPLYKEHSCKCHSRVRL